MKDFQSPALGSSHGQHEKDGHDGPQEGRQRKSHRRSSGQTQYHRPDGPHRRTGGNPQDIRFRQRVPKEGLEDGAGYRQPPTHQPGHQHPRKAQVHDDGLGRLAGPAAEGSQAG